MQPYTLKNNQLSVENYQMLRGTTKWQKLPDQQVKEALSKDLYSVSIFSKNRLVGMGRVIGDGAIYFYIQDVVVHPSFRKKGVGSLIMKAIGAYLDDSAVNYAFIGLMAAKGSLGFYEKHGYERRKDDAPGMYRIIKSNNCI